MYLKGNLCRIRLGRQVTALFGLYDCAKQGVLPLAYCVGQCVAHRPRTAGRPAQERPGRTACSARASGNGGDDARAAAIFADAALRRVLEVIDRRRPLAQLRPLLDGALVDTLLPAARRGDGVGSARLRRVRAQSVRADGTAAEVAANYTRGERVYAIACRVEQVTGTTGPRWQVVALHLG